MRIGVAVAALAAWVFLAAGAAEARVQIAIDLSSQTMQVNSSQGSYSWPISSARSGYSTPPGSYAPQSLERMHYSHKYHMSPMPYSIFFHGGYAIHGTYEVADLGRPASHGCIRLSPTHAAALFAMVKAEGAAISISGTPPGNLYARHHTAAPRGEVARAPARAIPALGYSPEGVTPTVWEWQQRPVWR
jgi:hypothetical protein